LLRRRDSSLPEQTPVYRDFRAGDVRHSLADTRKAGQLLGYVPAQRLEAGLELAMEWYCEDGHADARARTIVG
jgi:UDP-N-acetylglucosamine 4-epimerase